MPKKFLKLKHAIFVSSSNSTDKMARTTHITTTENAGIEDCKEATEATGIQIEEEKTRAKKIKSGKFKIIL